MTHRQIMEALSGLLLGMFVAILSSTIVSNALPRIISDLGGGQSAYTWVVTASLLTMTASTPLWGKLADLTSKKTLIQIALVVFVLASAGAGLSQNPGTLIAFRAVQGLGMGGMAALTQIVIGAMIPPRERGRYSGYLGATFAVATVGGPLVGGVITDTSWLGWRWCFYVGVPFAVAALVVLRRTLNLPVVKREVKVDWTGAFLIAAAVSLLLIWVTLAGTNYDWMSWQTAVMVGGSILLGLAFVAVEARAAEPIIPLRLFRNRTITMTSLASLFVGVAMFGATVFLSQYFQLARGESPTMSGVLTIPLIAGLFLSSTASGLLITRTGRWKRWLVSGAVLLTTGLALLGALRHDTPYWRTAAFMGLVGLGVGMMMQNLVLAAQNQVETEDLGAASSVVTFFRSLGGAVGVSVLGAVLAHRVTDHLREGLAAIGVQPGQVGDGGIPKLETLPPPVRAVVESAYGHGIGDIYLWAAPMALVALVFTLLIKEVPLKTTGGLSVVTGGPGQGPEDGAQATTPGTSAAPAGVSAATTGTGRRAEQPAAPEPPLAGTAGHRPRETTRADEPRS
ncbi:MFS transporter [Streptomyces sp. PLAI1-29]|uniref:MFS transporter n=2 Tax=Streptomyces zingiberis TaxID=2053010 RepID=A0ABX1BUV5_9ACTN|nr:MFS transporter [Streptomyces zingiberis]